MVDIQEKEKFDSVCRRVIENGPVAAGIGSLGEKYLHLILKTFLCENSDHHEVGQGSFVADILVEDTIYEIQTGGYHPLRRKLEYYLEETDRRIVIVTTAIARRRLMWVDPVSGQVQAGRCARVSRPFIKILRELYWLAPLVDFDRVSFWFPVLTVDEYRRQDGIGRDHKQRATKLYKLPTELLDIEEVTCHEDVARLFLPEGLAPRFTARDFSRATGARRLTLSSCLHALVAFGVIAEDGKEGRATAYRVCEIG